MKFIVLGLGSFGATLAEKLSLNGDEVIGVDKDMNKVEAIKDKIAYTICMDCSSEAAVTSLPLKDTDAAIVAIGEDQGANIMISALLKEVGTKKVVARAISSLHVTVLKAMGINDVIFLEEETASRWSNILSGRTA